jgi:ubiquitin-protein ligase
MFWDKLSPVAAILCTWQSFTLSRLYLFLHFQILTDARFIVPQEYSSLQKNPLEFLEIIEVNEDDIYTWKVAVLGPPSTPYAGGKFPIKIKFPAQYPFKPPIITFDCKIFHPSIKDGEICNAVISEGWGPTLNVKHCMETLYGMLEAPDADHPLDEECAQLLRDKPKEFEKQARKYTKKYAMAK